MAAFGSSTLSKSLKTVMPRVTKATLEAENAKLRKELERLRPRSRSPRRQVPARLTHAALEIATREFIRDPAIEELKEVILRQREEIQRLRAGEGPIGEVLLAMRMKECPTMVDDFITREMSKGTQSVASVLSKLTRLADTSHDLLRWGYSFWETRLHTAPFSTRS